MSAQPTWKMIADLEGLEDPINYGGLFIYVDENGTYTPEIELWQPSYGLAYRFSLERCAVRDGRLIPYKIAQADPASLPCPLPHYELWFSKDLEPVARFVGLKVDELVRRLCSQDTVERARAYRDLADYHGWYEFDHDPQRLTCKQAALRYGKKGK